MHADSQMLGPTAAEQVRRFAVAAVLTMAVALVGVLFFWDRGLSGIQFTSDLVQPYLVVEDFWADPASFYTWRHSPSPYVFPDMLIAVALVLLPLSPKWMGILYGTALLTGYSLAAGALIGKATNTDSRYAGFVFALCLLIVIVAAQALGGQLAPWLLLTLFAPFIHTGALLMTLLAMVLLERILRVPGSAGAKALLALMVLVTTFSDALFMVWFVLPALIVLWLHARACKMHLPRALMVSLFSAAAIAVAAERVFHGIKAGKPLRLDTIIGAADTLWSSALDAATEPDWVFVGLLAVTVIILLPGAVSLRRSMQRREMPFGDTLAIFLAASVILGVLAPILTSYFQEQSHWRYVLFFPLYAILKLAIILSRLMMTGRSARPVPAIGLAVVVAIMSPAAYRAATAPETPTDLEKCLDAHGLATGFGDYWVAKRLMFLSERKLHIVQLKSDGRLDTYNYNRDWFQHRADDGSAIAPDFILVTGLDAGRIRDKFGEPREAVQCAGTEVWLYDELNVR